MAKQPNQKTRSPEERRRENTRKPTEQEIKTVLPTEQDGALISRAEFRHIIHEAVGVIMRQDQEAKSEGKIELGRLDVPKGLSANRTEPPPERTPMLPLAINQLHGTLEHLSDIVRELEDKLSNVLMPIPESTDTSGGCPMSMAPNAVNGVRCAADRVSALTNQLSSIIDRLEA